ncbi:hypothetical protein [Teichococcus aestuarii]|uniref:hypothetical protein n=1 Tax=Teichococcus aestuarii TaxID=568898 RepID=UPI00361D64BD
MSAPRIDSAALGSLAGAAAAILHLAGALKSTPLGAALPVDLTLLAGALLLPLLAVLGLTRRWWLHPGLGPPLAGAALLWLWLVLAGSWSGSRAILAAKLPEVVLLAPVMLLAGLAVGADAGARRLAVAVTLASGPLVAVSVAVGLATGQVVLGGMAGTAGPDMLRVQYQLAGLAIACAAGLSAVRLVESHGWAGRLLWGGLTALLAAASLLPGGRTALAALVLAVLLVPALRCWSAGAPRRALGWLALAALGAAAALATLLLDEDAASGLRTLERLTQGDLEGSARPALWRAALAWGPRRCPGAWARAASPPPPGMASGAASTRTTTCWKPGRRAACPACCCGCWPSAAAVCCCCCAAAGGAGARGAHRRAGAAGGAGGDGLDRPRQPDGLVRPGSGAFDRSGSPPCMNVSASDSGMCCSRRRCCCCSRRCCWGWRWRCGCRSAARCCSARSGRGAMAGPSPC